MAKDKEKFKILVVDDEEDIVELLEYNLLKEGYEVKTASNGKQGLDIARTFLPNIILLDVMMPVMDGIEACKKIKEIPELYKTSILVLTARTEEYTEVAAFDAGADDFISKPIKPKALISRIAAVLKREKKKGDDKVTVLKVGDLTIDRSKYMVYQGETQVVLPRKEFELLYFLASNEHKVFNRDELLQKVWGTDVYVLSRTVDVHIRKVRERLGETYIKTIKGVGYKFELSD
jgi:two-component system alkaline phosphatase synthesis response regulator PhoP